MKARDPKVVQAEYEAAKARAAELEGIIKRAETELEDLTGGYYGLGRVKRLYCEALDAALPVVPREHPGSPGASDDFVVVKLTARQAVVRRYGSGDRRDAEVIIRATSSYPPVTLDQCREAWRAAGREVPS